MANPGKNVDIKITEKELENNLLMHKYNLYQQFFII